MTQMPSPQEILHQAFPGIPEAEAQELIASGQVHHYEPDTVLCREDTYEHIFYIILKGEVRVTKAINRTDKRILKNLVAGDFFGEMALIHDAPRAATVSTAVPTTVLEIHKDDFQNLLRHSASLSLAVAREVSRRLRVNDQMAIEDLRVKAGELASAYQQLAEQEYARREFLTTIAHELRTPLTAAGGFLQLIQSGQLPADALQSALGSVARNVQQIVSLVNDILFLQEMDLILPRFVPTDLKAVIMASVTRFQEAAASNNNHLNIEVQPDLPQIMGDAKSLERALDAVLDNAIKFSPNGGDIGISLTYTKSDIWIAVRDHGIGIPQEVLTRIFDRFFHLDQVGGYMFRGVGLGLSIARQVIEQHGGSISVESELGRGSLFQIQIHRSEIS